MQSRARWNLIFVGGIHGVGKSTFCRRVCDELGVRHLSAGSLISEQKARELGEKTVQDPDDNQRILLSALKNKIKDASATLLDGHFCLLSTEYRIIDIEANVFNAIEPRAFIVVVDEPEAIKLRLAQRDKKTYDLKLLVEFQERETAAARAIAENLKIPVKMISSSAGASDVKDLIVTTNNRLEE